MTFQIGDVVEAREWGIRGVILSVRTVGTSIIYRVKAGSMLADLAESDIHLAQDRSHTPACTLLRGEAVCSCGLEVNPNGG